MERDLKREDNSKYKYYEKDTLASDKDLYFHNTK